jgi:hypothetical protein
MRLFLALLAVVLLSFLPIRVNAQPAYTSTASSATYGYYQSGNVLFADVEFTYDTNAGHWSFSAPQFEVRVTKYTSYANFLSNTIHSQTTTTHTCIAGNWIYGGQGPGVGRLYGYLYLSLPQGFYLSVLVTPKASGDRWKPSEGHLPFSWTGTPQTEVADLLWPPDG